MALEQALICISLPAAADLSAKQYRFVKVNSSGQAAVSAVDEDAIGVLQNNPDAANKAATVAISGVSRVQCAGAITAGLRVSVDANGDAVAYASGDYAVGIALETGAAGRIISVLLGRMGVA